MSLAEHFIRGGEGYSSYVAEVVAANGGRVLVSRLIYLLTSNNLFHGITVYVLIQTYIQLNLVMSLDIDR